MRSTGKRKAIAIAAVLALLAGVAAAVALRGGESRGSGGAVASKAVTAKTKGRASDFSPNRAQIEAFKRMRLLREKGLAASPPEAANGPGEETIPPLTPTEEDAVKRAVDAAYDPTALRAVLDNGDPKAVPDYLSAASESFRSLTDVPRTDGDSPAVRQALSRAGILQSYAMNLLHAHRPGDEAQQREGVRRVNDSFRARIDALNEAYPFLGVQMVEAP